MRIAVREARAIHDGFGVFLREFQEITERARSRFEQRDWSGNQRDVGQRLELYGKVVHDTVSAISASMGPDLRRKTLWHAIKAAHALHIAGEYNSELAQTFYNSVARRMFVTVGVDPEIEYVTTEPALPAMKADPSTYRRFECDSDLEALFGAVLSAYRFLVPYKAAGRDAGRAAAEVLHYLGSLLGSHPVDAVETLKPVFFRYKAAFVVGRICSRKLMIPLVLSLRNGPEGVVLDAVLMSQNEVSILFSFTRSYFHVEAPRPRELVAFLRSIVPLKPVSELYIALGWNRHGKTELYRDLQRRLARPEGRFEISVGNPGMVMIVFALDAFDSVFKVIRDRFAPPKTTTRRQVMDRYRLVFELDRVGRLIDAQEFEHLEFDRGRFAEDLLEELVQSAGKSVAVRGDRVVIAHLYTERKVTPLNLFIQDANPERAARAVIDYGNAIKELAVANIFPGDFLLKNFGVTRHGRVVFYDYDELCLLTDCNFRRLPPARYAEQELAAETWYTVADSDVFPEEFCRFLGLPDDLRQVFERHHADLYTVEFWRGVQESHRGGEIPDFYPYDESKRLSAPPTPDGPRRAR